MALCILNWIELNWIEQEEKEEEKSRECDLSAPSPWKEKEKVIVQEVTKGIRVK